jgi:glutamyl-tRNA reductase
MHLVAAGLSFRSAPVSVRERAAVPESEANRLLRYLVGHCGLRGAAVLSTCNRTEFYVVENDTEAADAVWSALSARLGDDATPLGYVRRDRDAVRHLMRVTAGLDAMVLGEAQIQGQVRDAWELSRTRSGPVLNRLFQTSLSVAGRVRTETAIGRGSASVSSAAVQLAKKIFGTLAGRRAMILGAGQMAELALECLIDEGVRAALVANRTFERAEALARRHGATALRYDDCWDDLATVDLLLCSTSAPHAVVHPQHITPHLAARGGRPLCILDIALPRDVDPAVARLDNVFLYDLDDLRAVVAANIEQRRAQLPSAEQLIDGEVEKFWQWLAGLAAVPVVTEVRAAMERLRVEELAQALRRLGDLTPAQQETVEYLSRSLMNKFLHEPSVRLRAAAANGRGLGIVDAARYLFAVEHPDTPPVKDRSSGGLQGGGST